MKSEIRVLGGRLQYEIPMEPHWLPVPMWLVPQEFFDFEHLGHRHRKYMRIAELVDRGPDYIEFLFGLRIFGLPTPKARVRTRFIPPCDLEMQMLEGPMRGSNVFVRVTAKDGGMLGDEIHTLELPDAAWSRLLLAMLPPLMPAVRRFVKWRSDKLRDEDIPAFRRMAHGWVEDEVLWFGDLIRFPTGSGPARIDRLAVDSVFTGCADCGRFDMGYRHEGRVRCIRCDYLAVRRFVKWRSDKLRDEDIPAFRRMAHGWIEDEVLWFGDLIRYPPGTGALRVERLAVEAVFTGCADCGRFDMGYRHEGRVRCIRCDYLAVHGGEGHRVERRGAEIVCVPCVEMRS